MSKTQADFQKALAELRGQPAGAGDIGAALAEIRGGTSPAPGGHDSAAILRRNEEGRKRDLEEFEAEDVNPDQGFARKLTGGVASLAREIPGAEFLQAGARSLVRGQEYGDALSDIRGAEDALPLPAKIALRAPGAIASTVALPGSNLAKGAIYGALRGATDPEPEADRSTGTVVGGTLGGLLGAGGDAIGAIGSKAGKLLKLQGKKEGAMAKTLADKLRSVVRKAPTASTAPSASAPARMSGMESAFESAIRPTAPGPRAATNPIDELLEGMLGKLRSAQPHEVGNIWGDAEIAQGMHLPEPDLEALLRQSLAKGKLK